MSTSYPIRRVCFTRSFAIILCFIFLFALSGSVAQAQSDYASTPIALAPGAPAGSYPASNIDTVNLFNGNVNVYLPLLAASGRGGAKAPVGMSWDSPARWHVVKYSDLNGNPAYGTEPDYTYGPGGIHFGEVSTYITRSVGGAVNPCNPGTPAVWQYTLVRMQVVEPDGTEHQMRDVLTGGQRLTNNGCYSQGPSRGKVFVSTDGSGMTYVADDVIRDGIYVDGDYATGGGAGGWLLLKDGRRYRIDNSYGTTKMLDRNGNTISWGANGITDSLNRTISLGYDNGTQCAAVAPGASYCQYFTYQGVNNTERRVWIGYNSSFAPFSVVLPNGLSYRFYYNGYGDVTRIDLPTGGSIEYDYGAAMDGTQPDVSYWVQGAMPGTYFGGPNDFHVYRRVTERRLYKEGHVLVNRQTFSKPEYVYNIQGNPPSSYQVGNLGYVEKKEYDGGGSLLGSEKHFFYGSANDSFNIIDPFGYTPWKTGREYHTEIYDGSGNLLRQSDQTWEQRAPVSWWTGNPDAAPSNDPRLASTVTRLENNLTSQVSYGYDTTVPYNSLTDVYEYGYGNGTPGSLLRHTQTSFLKTLNGVDYTGSNIQDASGPYLRDLPLQVSVYGGGTERARTTYEYDNYASDAYHAPLVSRSGITGLDSAYTASYQTRGSVTRVSRWLLSSGTSINTYAQYDVAGNVVKAIDGREKVSEIEYSSAHQYAYPTKTTSPIPDIGNGFCSTTALETTTAYDFWTGLATSSTDANGRTTTVQYNDPLDRPTLVTRPDGGWTSYQYGDTLGNIFVRTQVLQNSAGTVVEGYQYFDGLARPYRSFQYINSDPTKPWLTSDIKYDSMGRVWKASNPYMSAGAGSNINPSDSWTTTVYDALGRVKTVTTPDGAQVVTAYSGNQVTVTDQAGKARRSEMDALGRLSQVIEDPNGLAYLTTYSYDVLGNLTTVAQDSAQANQRRYFMYESLSRLIRAKNPEQDANASLALTDPISGNSQWSLAYSYDANSNLISRTDARGVTSTYTYDNVNRNIVVNYPDGSFTNHTYDSADPATNRRGRLSQSVYITSTGAHSITAIDSYDAMGRPLYQRQHFYANGSWGTAFVTQRTYDYAGKVQSQTYPSGRVVNYSYDQAGRASGFTGNLGDGVTRTYAADIQYDEWGGLYRERFGTDIPLYHKEHRNIRGQIYDVRLSSVNDEWNWNRGAVVNYYNLVNYGFGTSGADNNGNLAIQQYFIPDNDAASSYSFMQQNYGYDSLNRLNWVGEYQDGATNTGSQSYSYDRFGNRTISAASGTGIPGQQFAVNPNTNRLGVPTGLSGAMQYDANGNLTNDTYSGHGTRTYDAENRMISATNTGGQQSVYTYDAEGRRVRRSSFGQETWQAYGMDGELIAEYAANTSPSSPQKEYGYRSGQLLVTATAPTRANVALSATATASSEHTYNGNPFPASRAIDDDRRGLNYVAGGVWQSSSSSTPQWLQLDFGASKTIDEIDVFTLQDNYSSPSEPTEAMTFSQYGLTSFQVQYWNGSAWADVTGGNVTGNNKVWRKFTFQALATTKIRVITNGSPDGWSRLTEVQAWRATGGADIRWLVADHLGTPRMIADKTGSLAGISRHDYLPFGEELYAGTGGRTTPQGYSGNDNFRQKFTQKERDVETGLDYFGARYYASTQGRFTGTDPLFIELKRLPYPQSWNLYAYTRNNPLKYIDPDGLEIKVECERSQQCTQTSDDLNQRKGAQFKTEFKGGKLSVVGEVDKGTLTKSERALYNAITDPKNIATIRVVTGSPEIMIGASALVESTFPGSQPIPGLNVVDRADLNQLKKADPAVAGEAIAHELMEAYVSVAEGLTNYGAAHKRANEFFGQVSVGNVTPLPIGAADAMGARTVYNFQRMGTKVEIEKTFFSPIPAQVVKSQFEKTPGTIKVILPNQGKKP